MAKQERNSIRWTDGEWSYRIEEEGHLFRFRGKHATQDEWLDYGLIPGGAFVAIGRLVDHRIRAEKGAEDVAKERRNESNTDGRSAVLLVLDPDADLKQWACGGWG